MRRRALDVIRRVAARRPLGRQFGWLWAAYAVSAYGSGLGFGALPLIAVLALRASPAQVSALSAVGPAVGALIAVPLAPWVEFRRKRPVMIAMDLTRFAVMATIPVAYALGRLSIAWLLVVSAVVAAAKIAFNAASGAYLKALVQPADLLVANARFESTNWSSIAVGPPLGGAAIGLFGPVITVVADALSYLLSALGITAIRGREEAPRAAGHGPVRAGALLDGWRHILGHPQLRALYLNNMLVAGLIMATEPLLAVLLLRQLGFPPWQYGLAFAAPCVGGLIGSRLARRVVTRYGQHRVFATVGTLRAVWLIGLAFIRPGVVGLGTVIAVELAIIISMSLYSPVLATYRLEHTPPDRIARTLAAWSIGQQAAIATCTALGGLLADVTSPRTALAVAGLLILASPLLLPRRRPAPGGRESRVALPEVPLIAPRVGDVAGPRAVRLVPGRVELGPGGADPAVLRVDVHDADDEQRALAATLGAGPGGPPADVDAGGRADGDLALGPAAAGAADAPRGTEAEHADQPRGGRVAVGVEQVRADGREFRGLRHAVHRARRGRRGLGRIGGPSGGGRTAR
jgi:predicted MFS family arabinose efflux permease